MSIKEKVLFDKEERKREKRKKKATGLAGVTRLPRFLCAF
jgi:hypothetical protein